VNCRREGDRRRGVEDEAGKERNRQWREGDGSLNPYAEYCIC